MEIEKTNRMNALFEFYAALLTDKQMNYIELYYADDYSLAEIAEEFGVSRQAVYDNIKRTEKILEDYEMKLHMYSDYIVRSQILEEIAEKYPEDSFLQEQIATLSSIDNRDKSWLDKLSTRECLAGCWNRKNLSLPECKSSPLMIFLKRCKKDSVAGDIQMRL